jgi:hypothetical protein
MILRPSSVQKRQRREPHCYNANDIIVPLYPRPYDHPKNDHKHAKEERKTLTVREIQSRNVICFATFPGGVQSSIVPTRGSTEQQLQAWRAS